MVTRFAAAGRRRVAERRREDLRAAGFRLAPVLFLELLRAGATFFLVPADLREGAALRTDVRFRADARLPELRRSVDFLALLFRPPDFLREVFRPPLEPPRDDFLAAAMM